MAQPLRKKLFGDFPYYYVSTIQRPPKTLEVNIAIKNSIGTLTFGYYTIYVHTYYFILHINEIF